MNRTLPEKVTRPRLVSKFSASYDNLWLIMLSHASVTCLQPAPEPLSRLLHTIFRSSILILFSHLRLGFQVVSFHQMSAPCTYLSCPSYVSHAPPISFFFFVVRIRPTVHEVSPLTQLSPVSCYVILFTAKYFRHCPILEHPQPMFHPKCERMSITPLQNNTQITVLCILIFIFWSYIKLEDKRFCTE